jgi:hypothetical protein
MAAMVQKMRTVKALEKKTQPPSNDHPPTSRSTPEDQAGTSTENRQGNKEPERGGISKSINALRKQHPGMSGTTKLAMSAAQV